MADLELIKEAIIKGKRKDIPDMVRAALDDGADPHGIINDYMFEALKVVGTKFEAKKIFVPEMMIAARAMQAGLDLEYSQTMAFFTWQGFDEMDEVHGSGNAELLDDGTLEIEFAYHNGDEAILKAKPMPFSAPC